MLTRPAREPDLVLRYAERADGVVDVFLPAGSPPGAAALVVMLHGGFWRAEWDRMHARPMASALADKGFAVAVPEFRRVGDGGEWPVIGEDVETALRAVRGLVASAQPGAIEPAEPLVLTGHSSGGHLALWAGLRAPAALVSRVVALAPVMDLPRAAREHLGDDAAHELLGGEPDDAPDAYAAADVVRRMVAQRPVTVLHGDQDQRVPVQHSRDVIERVRAAGGSPAYQELAGVGHFELIDPESPAWQAVRATLSEG